VLKCDIDRISL